MKTMGVIDRFYRPGALVLAVMLVVVLGLVWRAPAAEAREPTKITDSAWSGVLTATQDHDMDYEDGLHVRGESKAIYRLDGNGRVSEDGTYWTQGTTWEATHLESSWYGDGHLRLASVHTGRGFVDFGEFLFPALG